MKFRYLKNVVTLELDQGKCNGCGLCIEVCPQQVFTLNGKRSSITDRDACLECGACARNCAPGAISVRPGVGCAYAVLMDMFNIKSKCCFLPENRVLPPECRVPDNNRGSIL